MKLANKRSDSKKIDPEVESALNTLKLHSELNPKD